MSGKRGRAGSVLMTVLAAFGLVAGGLVPPATADPGGSETTVTVASAQWWQGQRVPLEATVTHDGVPLENAPLAVFVDGRFQAPTVRPPTGTGTLYFVSGLVPPGRHVVEVRHMDYDAPDYGEPGSCSCFSSASVEVEVLDPGTMLTPASWFYGDRTTLHVALPGPSDAWSGTIETFGGLESAPIVDGAADLPLGGRAVQPGSMIWLYQRSDTGRLLSTWALPVDVRTRTTTLEATLPGTVRQGAVVTVPVRVSSPDGGKPQGTVAVEYTRSGTAVQVARATLTDGRAAVKVAVDRIPTGTRTLTVRYTQSDGQAPFSFAGSVHTRSVTVLPRRATQVTTSTGDSWTYAKSRKVTVRVAAAGADPDGRVELWAGRTKVASARVVDGRGTLAVGATRVEPGRRSLTATFVPAVATDAPSKRSWTQQVRKAPATVRLTMDRTRFRAGRPLGGAVHATVRVSVPGLAETGALCLQTRQPGRPWSECWIPGSGPLRSSHHGVKRTKVPSAALVRFHGPERGKMYVRVTYTSRDPDLVAGASRTVTTVWR
ncbi:hypothetical protein ACFQ80_19350 [Isoptericola sp. NPDC056578]|uniref:hypothetical protein n=1 Tax=Isoptericola sp. NPDC056578 TaxID=3345870 RepID=UPI003686D3E7